MKVENAPVVKAIRDSAWLVISTATQRGAGDGRLRRHGLRDRTAARNISPVWPRASRSADSSRAMPPTSPFSRRAISTGCDTSNSSKPSRSMCGSWSTSTWPVARTAPSKRWRLRRSSALEKERPSLKAGKASATSDSSPSRPAIFSSGSPGCSRTPSRSFADLRSSGSRSRKACSGRMKRPLPESASALSAWLHSSSRKPCGVHRRVAGGTALRCGVGHRGEHIDRFDGRIPVAGRTVLALRAAGTSRRRTFTAPALRLSLKLPKNSVNLFRPVRD